MCCGVLPGWNCRNGLHQLPRRDLSRFDGRIGFVLLHHMRFRNLPGKLWSVELHCVRRGNLLVDARRHDLFKLRKMPCRPVPGSLRGIELRGMRRRLFHRCDRCLDLIELHGMRGRHVRGVHGLVGLLGLRRRTVFRFYGRRLFVDLPELRGGYLPA